MLSDLCNVMQNKECNIFTNLVLHAWGSEFMQLNESNPSLALDAFIMHQKEYHAMFGIACLEFRCHAAK